MVTEKELELLACLEKSSRLSVDTLSIICRYISEAVKYRSRRSKEDGCEIRK